MPKFEIHIPLGDHDQVGEFKLIVRTTADNREHAPSRGAEAIGLAVTKLAVIRYVPEGNPPQGNVQELRSALAVLVRVVRDRFDGLEIVASVPGELIRAVVAAQKALGQRPS